MRTGQTYMRALVLEWLNMKFFYVWQPPIFGGGTVAEATGTIR